MSDNSPPPFTIRRMTEVDIDPVADIAAQSFHDPWERSSFVDELHRPFARVLVVENASGEVVAFTNYWHVADEAEVLNVATRPEHRRHGAGRALMSAMLTQLRIDSVRRVLLEVRPSNLAAVEMYRALGFEVLHTRPRYYRDGEDAWVMVMQLVP